MKYKNLKSSIFIPAVFLAVFLLSGCSGESNTQSQSLKSYTPNQAESSTYKYTPTVEYDESETYEESTFNGYECTDDCSGHEAGYEWAEEQGITDSSDCDGNSNSFIEGCESYADEQGEDSYDSDYYDSGYDY